MVNGISADQLRDMIRDDLLVPTLCSYEDAVAVLDMIPIAYDDIERWNAVIVSDVFEPHNREHHRAVLNSIVADYNDINEAKDGGSVVEIADVDDADEDDKDEDEDEDDDEDEDEDEDIVYTDSDTSESSSDDAHAIGYMRIHRVLDTINSNISMTITISLVTWATTTIGIAFMFASMWKEIGALKGNTC